MKSPDRIPYYAPDGTSLGFRALDTAERLVAGGFVKPSYGRKNNLRAIWQCQVDGGNPVETSVQAGTRYSFLETLEHGRCYTLRRVDQRDENGTVVSMRAAFRQTVLDCTRS